MAEESSKKPRTEEPQTTEEKKDETTGEKKDETAEDKKVEETTEEKVHIISAFCGSREIVAFRNTDALPGKS